VLSIRIAITCSYITRGRRSSFLQLLVNIISAKALESRTRIVSRRGTLRSTSFWTPANGLPDLPTKEEYQPSSFMTGAIVNHKSSHDYSTVNGLSLQQRYVGGGTTNRNPAISRASKFRFSMTSKTSSLEQNTMRSILTN
jgi:hypothetical protein